ncbi:MAG: Bug family tripartite tricarboxylate transporter substrate binding protein [Burkholderiales bacterium]
MRATFRLIFMVAALALSVSAPAQEFPSKPIRIIVPYPPGGGTDRTGRLLAERFQAKWGQSVLVENRSGAGGAGAEYAAKAAPDGYTLLFAAQAQFVIVQALYDKLGYDPDAMVPISTITTSPNVLVVNPKIPVESLARLISFAKENPGKLNYASTGSGSSQHLAAELFKSMAGLDMLHIPYKGTAPAITDLVAGHVQLMFMEISNAITQVKAGKLRVIAVGGEKRHAAFPGTPALVETLPGFVSMQWTGLAAPAGTPSVIAEKIWTATVEALKHPDTAQRIRELSLETVGSTPAETTAFWRQERDRWGKVIRATGAKAD